MNNAKLRVLMKYKRCSRYLIQSQTFFTFFISVILTLFSLYLLIPSQPVSIVFISHFSRGPFRFSWLVQTNTRSHNCYVVLKICLSAKIALSEMATMPLLRKRNARGRRAVVKNEIVMALDRVHTALDEGSVRPIKQYCCQVQLALAVRYVTANGSTPDNEWRA